MPSGSRRASPPLGSRSLRCSVLALVSANLRLVTHLDVDAAAIDRAVAVFASFFEKAAANAAD